MIRVYHPYSSVNLIEDGRGITKRVSYLQFFVRSNTLHTRFHTDILYHNSTQYCGFDKVFMSRKDRAILFHARQWLRRASFTLAVQLQVFCWQCSWGFS